MEVLLTDPATEVLLPDPAMARYMEAHQATEAKEARDLREVTLSTEDHPTEDHLTEDIPDMELLSTEEREVKEVRDPRVERDPREDTQS